MISLALLSLVERGESNWSGSVQQSNKAISVLEKPILCLADLLHDYVSDHFFNQTLKSVAWPHISAHAPSSDMLSAKAFSFMLWAHNCVKITPFQLDSGSQAFLTLRLHPLFPVFMLI